MIKSLLTARNQQTNDYNNHQSQRSAGIPLTTLATVYRKHIMSNLTAINEATVNNVSRETLNTNEAAESTRVYSDKEANKTAALNASPTDRTIVIRGRQPSWVAAINLPSSHWPDLSTVPAHFKPLIEAVIETSAKAILTRLIGSMAIKPTTINLAPFTPDNLISEATAVNSEYLSKDQLTALWETSQTRKDLISDPRYTTNSAYRGAVSYFADLVIKLSGRTSRFTPEELDKILARLNTDDLDTELGSFVVRRIEQLKAKPVQEKADLLDLI